MAGGGEGVRRGMSVKKARVECPGNSEGGRGEGSGHKREVELCPVGSMTKLFPTLHGPKGREVVGEEKK